MDKSIALNQRLSELKNRLDQIQTAWTVNDHEEILEFFVKYIPELICAQRCSIFVADSSSDKIWLKHGTGLGSRQKIEAPKKKSIVGESISSGMVMIENNLMEKEGYHHITDKKTKFLTRNIICVPINSLVEGKRIGAIQVLNKKNNDVFDEEDALLLKTIEKYLALALESTILNTELKNISNQISNNIDFLKKERVGDITFIANSPEMRKLLDTVLRVSRVPVNILITGESGTGKEIIARLIHNNSERANGRFVPVNCSSIPENLMESEFFGHTKGAFTGAIAGRTGRFEEAAGGSLFLDEIGDMPQSIQPKFLRALQENEGSRVGSNEIQKYDFRLINATCKNLKHEIEKGGFREDLYFRLFAVEINIPPLRERKEDIIPLALMFSSQISQRFNRKFPGFDKNTLKIFETFPWPGNVRQLIHEVERMIALTPEGELLSIEACSNELQSSAGLNPSHACEEINIDDGKPVSLKKFLIKSETRYIKKILEMTNNNKTESSKMLGISRQALYKKIKKWEK